MKAQISATGIIVMQILVQWLITITHDAIQSRHHANPKRRPRYPLVERRLRTERTVSEEGELRGKDSR